MKRVVVYGDAISDVYSYLVRKPITDMRSGVNKPRSKDGVPVYVVERKLTQSGGASAVCNMLQRLDVEVHDCTFGSTVKYWYVSDDKPKFRIDVDTITSEYPTLTQTQTDCFVFSDYGKTRASRSFLRNVDSPVIVVDPYVSVHPSEYTGANIVLPNDDAFYAYIDEWLSNFEWVIHKQGADGVCIYRNGKIYDNVPGIRVPVIDACGAGDQFLAAFVRWLKLKAENELDIDLAIRMANAAGAVCCTRIGTVPATEKEIEAVYRRSTYRSS